MYSGLAHAEGSHAVSLHYRIGGGGAGEEGGAGGAGGVGKQGIEAKALQGRSDLGRVGLWPGRGNGTAVAVQL